MDPLLSLTLRAWLDPAGNGAAAAALADRLEELGRDALSLQARSCPFAVTPMGTLLRGLHATEHLIDEPFLAGHAPWVSASLTKQRVNDWLWDTFLVHHYTALQRRWAHEDGLRCELWHAPDRKDYLRIRGQRQLLLAHLEELLPRQVITCQSQRQFPGELLIDIVNRQHHAVHYLANCQNMAQLWRMTGCTTPPIGDLSTPSQED